MSSYAQPSDLEARYPASDLVQITDPNALAIQTATIQFALTDASSEIDTYIESRFTLPFTDAPANLVRVCCDIAIYRLNTLRPVRDMEDCRKRYEDAIKWLQGVRDGKNTMGMTADSVEPTIAKPTVLTQETTRRTTAPTLAGTFNLGTLRTF